jgi:hypothetical protein
MGGSTNLESCPTPSRASGDSDRVVCDCVTLVTGRGGVPGGLDFLFKMRALVTSNLVRFRFLCELLLTPVIVDNNRNNRNNSISGDNTRYHGRAKKADPN